jgi:hypothetical protein
MTTPTLTPVQLAILRALPSPDGAPVDSLAVVLALKAPPLAVEMTRDEVDMRLFALAGDGLAWYAGVTPVLARWTRSTNGDRLLAMAQPPPAPFDIVAAVKVAVDLFGEDHIAWLLLTACEEIAAWRRITGAETPAALLADLADMRARLRGKPDRGTLIDAIARAGAARVEAAGAVDRAPSRGQEREAAIVRFNEADAAEREARAALTAFEREHGLTVTCRETVTP